MSSSEIRQPREPGHINVPLANRRSGFDVEDVRNALKEGLDPNIQWEQADIEGQRQYGGCVVYSFDPEHSWANYNTPLHRSLHEGKFGAAALLLEHGARINLLNALGRTSLHEAVSRSDSEAVKFLVEKGANLNAMTEERSFEDEDTRRSGTAGILPLHEAIRAWNLEAAELIIEGGADLNRTSPGGWTILDLALLERNEPLIDLLYKHGARLSGNTVPSQGIYHASTRELSQVLLTDTNIFPPSACRPIYLSIISHPEFLKVFRQYPTMLAPNCTAFLDKFYSILYEKAGRPNPENVAGQPKCAQCVKFLREVSPERPGPFQLYPDRSSLSLSAKDGCCLCAIFEDALVHTSGRWAHPNRKFQKMEGSTMILLTGSFSIHKISITVHCEHQHETLEVYNLSESFMIDHQAFPDHPELGTASPRALKTACAWLENCRAHHSACSNGKDVSPVLPSRVIDVGNDSLEPRLHVSNGECAPYLALSYCWGLSDNLATTEESLRDRMEAIPLASFPLTLRDAVLATRQLGFRFLWVDAVCIIQDDANDWEIEAVQMKEIYANASMTLSAHDSDDTQGGLYRPRQDRITSPVQVSLRVPKRYQEGREAHRTGFCVLPVHGEKELLKPSQINTRAWTLQEQFLSTRVLHWGPGILYWECLCSHGSESDPEGNTHPYNSSCTNFMNVRHRKRVVQGRTQEGDFSYRQWPEDERLDCCGSEDELESPTEESVENAALNYVDEHVDNSAGEDGTSDGENVEDENPGLGGTEEEDAETGQKADPERITYLEWQRLVSEYTSRGLTRTTDRIPAFLSLSEMMAKTIQDEFILGLWKKSYFFPSLLWVAPKLGGRSRNEDYPSWTWASIEGRITYPIDLSGITWEPSDASLDVRLFGPSQNHATGSITLRSHVRKLPVGFKFWRYENQLLNPFMTYTFGKRDDWDTKSQKTLEEELMVVEGFRDVRPTSPKSDQAGRWEGAGSDIYCVVIGRIGKKPPPRVGYPAFPGGRPKSVVCLCLTPVRQADGDKPLARRNTFRRVGLCHFWDTPIFWKMVSGNQCVNII